MSMEFAQEQSTGYRKFKTYLSKILQASVQPYLIKFSPDQNLKPLHTSQACLGKWHY